MVTQCNLGRSLYTPRISEKFSLMKNILSLN